MGPGGGPGVADAKESAVGKVGMGAEWKRGNTNAVSAQGTTEDGRRRSEIVAAGGPRVEVKKGGVGLGGRREALEAIHKTGKWATGG